MKKTLSVIMGIASLAVFAKPAFPPPSERLQHILISFDSTPNGRTKADGSLDMMGYDKYRFLDVLRKEALVKKVGYVPSITLFINGKFLQVSPKWKPAAGSKWAGNQGHQKYLFPSNIKAGFVIDFAASPDEAINKGKMIKEMIKLGVEIGNHSVRHLHPGHQGWGYNEWQKELDEHIRIMNLFNIPTDHVGMRSPFLSTSAVGDKMGLASMKDPYFQHIKRLGYRYDTSKVYRYNPQAWPSLVAGSNILEFPIPSVPSANGKGKNLYFGSVQKISPESYKKITYREFDLRYQGSRAPLLVSGHGERAQETLEMLKDLCFRPKVRCTSFADFLKYTDQYESLPK